jgi:hypothetical protein
MGGLSRAPPNIFKLFMQKESLAIVQKYKENE